MNSASGTVCQINDVRLAAEWETSGRNPAGRPRRFDFGVPWSALTAIFIAPVSHHALSASGY